VLVRNRTPRLIVQAIAIAILLALFALPFLVIVLGAFATSWSGVLPSGATLGNFSTVFTESATANTVTASLITAVVATVIALVVATTAALSTRRSPALKRVVDTVFLLPVAIPSVAVGLALLMAFSSGPLPLNGTVWIVIVAHTVLVVALAYQPISAAVSRLDPAFEEAASALGAGKARIIATVVLPLLRPALAGAAAMCIAMSMGELTAMMMVAPPTWRTMPLQIFSFTSRGIRLYEGAAMAVLLLLITLTALLVLQRVAGRRTGITAGR
jgi:2-aminoethylphosphonate transport system permease protein